MTPYLSNQFFICKIVENMNELFFGVILVYFFHIKNLEMCFPTFP